MPSDALDFRTRAHLSEWMDEPCTYAQFHSCLISLRFSNRLTFNYRPTLRWMRQFRGLGRKLHLVDVGSGGGDMLRRIERWAARNDVSLCLTGIDLNPHAARAARASTPATSTIQWVTGDAFSAPLDPAPDLIISSLFTHHLPEPEIVGFLAWMERTAAAGWFISDLERDPVPYFLYRALSQTLRFHPFVRHDGPVSIRRAFRPADWHRMLAAAQIPPGAAQVYGMRPARLCVSRVRDNGHKEGYQEVRAHG